MNIIQSNNNIFSMSHIGKTISKRRKDLNLTQGELAESLGVSHQAVSSWENGMTSPDISKLSDLSNLLNISIDELLGNKHFATIVEKVQNDEEISRDEVIDIAPITKPAKLNDFYESLDEETKDLHTLLALAPFVDEDRLQQWVDAIPNFKLSDLAPLAPFLDKDYLSKRVLNQLDQNPSQTEALSGLLPFVNDDAIKGMFQILSHQDDVSLAFIAPFVDEDDIDAAVKRAISNPDFKSERFYALAPFMSSEAVEQIVTFLIKEKRTDEIHAFAPFL